MSFGTLVSSVKSERSWASRFCSIDETDVVLREERFHGVGEGEAADTHEVADDAAFGQQIESFANSRVATTESHDGESGAGAAFNDGSRNEFRSSLVFLEQAIHDLTVFVRDFGVSAEFVVARAADEIGGLGVNAGQGARRDLVFVFVGVALELGELLDFFQAEDAATVGLIVIVPLEARDHPIVHADVEVGHDEDGGLEALGEIESDGCEFEALGRVGRKQQNMFGVAVRGVGAFQQIALLRAGGHAGGGADALHVDDDGGNLGIVGQAEQFIHERDAGAGGGGEGARAVPCRADHHADGGQFVLGLNDDVVVLAGFRIFAVLFAEDFEGVHRGGGGRDGIPGGHCCARVNAAERDRGVAVDQDLVAVFIHLFQMKRQRADRNDRERSRSRVAGRGCSIR